ncbi:MAG: hypothetical protein MUE81_18525 [Thermoflexibacter sp.]|nr:hypothetical protein [Thermoflexibacter sp.]
MLFLYFQLKKLQLFIVFALFPLFVMARPSPIVISDDFTKLRIGEYMTYYIEQKGEALTIDDIPNKQFDTFVYNRKILNFDFIYSSLPKRPKIVWLKMDVQTLYPDPSKRFLLEIKSPLLDQVEFYYYENGQWHGQVTGSNFPIRKRMFEHRTFLFDIQNLHNQRRTYYLKITTDDLMVVYPILHESNVFVKYAMNEQIVFGIFFGLLIALLGFNVINWYFQNGIIYIFFLALIFIGSLMMIRINGYSYIYLWVGNNWWENRAFPLLTGSFSALLTAFNLFFLKIAKEKYIRKMLFINLLISGLIFFTALVYPNFEVAAAGVGVAIWIVFGTFILAIYDILRGEAENKFFVTATYALSMGIILTFLRLFDIIETTSFLGTYGMEIGFLAFIILTSISMRIRNQKNK